MSDAVSTRIRNKGSSILLLVPVLSAISCTDERVPSVASIAFDTVVVLSFDTLYAPVWGAAAAFDPSTGMSVVSPAPGSGELYLFDSGGTLIRRFGREGRGPEELRRVEEVLLRDSIHVLDPGNRRITMYSVAGDFGRSVTVEGLERTAAWTPRGVVVRVPGDGLGDLVAVRVAGEEPKPFLYRDSVAHLSGDDEPYAHFATAGNGGIWVAGLRHYQIRRFSNEGSATAAFSYRPDWFDVVPRNVERHSGWVDDRSVVDGLSEASDGTLWVKLGVPEAAYPDTTIAFEALDNETIDLFVDEVIEGIDSKTGRVIAHRRLPFNSLTLLPGGHAWILDEREDGEPHIVIVRLRVSS